MDNNIEEEKPFWESFQKIVLRFTLFCAYILIFIGIYKLPVDNSYKFLIIGVILLIDGNFYLMKLDKEEKKEDQNLQNIKIDDIVDQKTLAYIEKNDEQWKNN